MITRCASPGDFKKYFDENMQALGLPVPTSLFETYERALATALVMTSTFHTLGPGATLAELIGATTALEKLGLIGSIGAVFYVGAAVGSIFVANSRMAICGDSVIDLPAFLYRHNLTFIGWERFFVQYSQVIDVGHPCRRSFGLQARSGLARLRPA